MFAVLVVGVGDVVRDADGNRLAAVEGGLDAIVLVIRRRGAEGVLAGPGEQPAADADLKIVGEEVVGDSAAVPQQPALPGDAVVQYQPVVLGAQPGDHRRPQFVRARLAGGTVDRRRRAAGGERQVRVLVGDGDYREPLEEELPEEIENVQADVVGWVDRDEIPKQLNRLQLLVVPSHLS